MSSQNPYPLVRPYYKRHSREKDEKLARELFYGTSIIDKKTGRQRHYYPLEGSQDEQAAFEAVQRLLIFSCTDLDEEILGGLYASLDRGGSFGRRLIFEKKRKQRADSSDHLTVAMSVWSLHRAGWGIDAAVADAEKKYKVSRKTVYVALARIKRENPGLENLVTQKSEIG